MYLNIKGAYSAGICTNIDTLKSGKVQYGIASYYSDKFIGKTTANGDVFSQDKMTAAHNFLPLGTKIRVTNLRNNKSIVVRINDRMHHRNKRLVDLTKAAAQKLGFMKSGITRVKIQVFEGQIEPD
jgi:rare lipoprotein A